MLPISLEHLSLFLFDRNAMSTIKVGSAYTILTTNIMFAENFCGMVEFSW